MEELRRDSPAPGVLRLTLDRPDVHNAMTIALQRQIDVTLSEAAQDDSVKVVILAGAGERTFCAGYRPGAHKLSRRRCIWTGSPIPRRSVG